MTLMLEQLAPNDLDNEFDILFQIQSPSDIGAYEKFIQSGELDILIDKEIITIGGLDEGDATTNTPPQFTGCSRGQYGTFAAPHAVGATIYHLPEAFGSFLADLNSNLPGIIAQNFADKFNAIDGDMVFPDCAECPKRLLPQSTPILQEGTWYAVPFVAEQYRQKIQKGIIIQGSGLSKNSNYAWYLYSRGTGGDYATIGVEGRMDHIRIGRYHDTIFSGSFFPMELGWMALLAKVPSGYDENASYPATTLDEMEYQMNRALGFNIPISLETHIDVLEANGASSDILKLIGKYEELREQCDLSSNLLEKFKRPDTNFINSHGLAKEQYHLVRKWFCKFVFKRQVYIERVLSPGECWEFTNPFHKQKLKVKITALPSHAKFDHADNEELLSVIDEFKLPQSIEDVTISKADNGTIEMEYKQDAPHQSLYDVRWMTTKMPATNLLCRKVLELKVTGDGKGEVVAVHLIDSKGNQRQFQFVVDFSCTKNIRFPLPSGNSFFEHEPWYGDVRVIRYFDWSSVVCITIYMKKIPLDQNIVCLKLHAIRMLKQRFSAPDKPTLSINNKTITFNTALDPRKKTLNAEPWDYVEFDGSFYRKYDGNNNQRGRLRFILPWRVPRVRSGSNTLTYTHDGPNLALVRILLEGPTEFSG